MGGEILFAWSGIITFVGLMLGISEQGARHVVGIEKVGGFVAVVNRQNKSAIQAPGDFADPVASLEARFGLLAFFEGNLLRGEVLADGAGGKRDQKFHEGVAVVADENFLKVALLLANAMHRERVKKLIGKNAAGGDACWNFDGGAALPFLEIRRELLGHLIATRGRAFYGHIAQGGVKSGQLGVRKRAQISTPALGCVAVERSPAHVAIRWPSSSPPLISRKGSAAPPVEIPARPFPAGCIFSNELLDALPVHRVRQQEGHLQEIFVGNDGLPLFVETPRSRFPPAPSASTSPRSRSGEKDQQAEAGLEACRLDQRNRPTPGSPICSDD